MDIVVANAESAEPQCSVESIQAAEITSNVAGSGPAFLSSRPRTSRITSGDSCEHEVDFYYEIMSNRAIHELALFLFVPSVMIMIETIVIGIIARVDVDSFGRLETAEWLTLVMTILNFVFMLLMLVICICFGIIVFFLTKPRNNQIRSILIMTWLATVASLMGTFPIGTCMEIVLQQRDFYRPWLFYLSNATGRIAVGYWYVYLMVVTDYAGFSIKSGSNFNVTRKLPGLWPLFADKTIFAVIQVAVVLGLNFGLDVYPGAFAWTSWIVLIKAAIEPVDYVLLSGRVIAATVVTSIADLSGLVMFLVKLRSRSRDLFKLPLYQNAKESLFLKLHYVFTLGLWFFCLVFGLAYLNIIAPLPLLYQVLEQKVLLASEFLPGVLLVYLIYLWVFCLTILLLPATSPGVRGLFLFYRTKRIHHVVNQRANFKVSARDSELIPNGTQQVHLEPRTVYWDIIEVAFNFSKLSYGPPYKDFELMVIPQRMQEMECMIRNCKRSCDEAEMGSNRSRSSCPRSRCESRKRKRTASKEAIEAQKFLIAGQALKKFVHDIHGFKLVADVFNAQSDSRVIIFESDHYIIVSFRGTVTTKNWKTDINSALINLFSMWNRRFGCGKLCSECCTSIIACQQNDQDERLEFFHGNDCSRATCEDLKANLLKLIDMRTIQENENDSTGWQASTRLSHDDYQALKHSVENNLIGVHAGFLKAYLMWEGQIASQVVQIHEQSKTKPIIVTGHSMGSALATLLILDLVINRRVPVESVYGVTFGGPKLGNKDFSSMVKHLALNINRVVNAGDIVSKIPRRTAFGRSYSHCGNLVLIDKYGNLLITPTWIEKYFLHRSRLGIAEHRLAEYARRFTTFADSLGQDFSFYTQTFVDILDKKEYASMVDSSIPASMNNSSNATVSHPSSTAPAPPSSIPPSATQDESTAGDINEWLDSVTQALEENDDGLAEQAMEDYRGSILSCL